MEAVSWAVSAASLIVPRRPALGSGLAGDSFASVDDFAVAVLARTAREIIELRGETVLSGSDWERFLALLVDPLRPIW